MPTDKTIALAAEFQRQVEALTDDYVNQTGHVLDQPAEALTGILRMLRWGLKFTTLPEERFAECDLVRRTIRVASDLDQRLEQPGVARRYCHALIAHELAHAVLHSKPRRSRAIPKRWEYEARVWSTVFLCPWRLMVDRPEVAALRGNNLLMKERWSRVIDLADHFQVTSSFMVSALVLYGVLERTPGGGIQAPCVLASYARPWKQAS